MEDTEMMKIAKEILKDVTREASLLFIIKSYIKAFQDLQIEITKQKYKGTKRTLSDKELAHNNALSLSLQILRKRIGGIKWKE